MRALRRVRGWALDYVHALRALASSMRAGDPPELYLPGDRHPDRPIVVVPGVYETWRFLRPTVQRLHAAGHPVHVLVDLGRNAGRVPAAAQVLARHLEQRDLRGVVLVAHSKGGLIGKHVMAFDDPERRVERMIAIATPFHGSRLAALLPLASIRDFAPRDATLRRLAERRDVNGRITSIWAEFDPHVPGGSALPGAVNVRLPEVGHFRILAMPALHRAVDRALADAVREDRT